MALEDKAFAARGQPFNLASPKQLGEILFDKMKLPTLRKTATGQPSTDEEVLTEPRQTIGCRRSCSSIARCRS